MANLPPKRDDYDSQEEYQIVFDQWSYEVTQDLNTVSATATGGGDVTVDTDNQDRPVIGGIVQAYQEPFLDTAYGTNSTGANFSGSLSGLTADWSELWQGVLNTASGTQSTTPSAFTWRQIVHSIPDLVGSVTDVAVTGDFPTNLMIGNRINVTAESTHEFITRTAILAGGVAVTGTGSDLRSGQELGGGDFPGAPTDGVLGDFSRITYSAAVSTWDNFTWAYDNNDNTNSGRETGIFLDDGTELIFAAGQGGADNNADFFRGDNTGLSNAALLADVMETGQTLEPGWYYWDGTEWLTLIPYYRTIGGRQINWLFTTDDTITGFNIDDGSTVLFLDSVSAVGTVNIGVIEGSNDRTDIAYFAAADGTDPVYPTGTLAAGDYTEAIRGARRFRGERHHRWTTTELAPSTTASEYVITQIEAEDGDDGDNGDNSRTIYLFQNGTDSPAVPANTAGFVASTGLAEATGDWAVIATVPPPGGTIYVASLLLVQTGGEGDWAASGDWVANPASASGTNGMNGAQGAAGPRFAETTFYLAATVAPAPPTATITWATGAIVLDAASTTAGWTRTPPTQVASSNLVVYSAILTFIDSAGTAATSTVTAQTSIQGTSFTGFVTFNSGDFAIDGSTITTIDGGNITAGTVTADNVRANTAISSPTITGGVLQTSTTGARVVINSSGLQLINASGVVVVEFAI